MCILVCLLVFQILVNVKNLKNPFCFSPFGQHLSGSVKCSTPVPWVSPRPLGTRLTPVTSSTLVFDPKGPELLFWPASLSRLSLAGRLSPLLLVLLSTRTRVPC